MARNARNLAAEARDAAMACDGIGCSKTAEALRALAAEFEQLQPRNIRGELLEKQKDTIPLNLD